MSGDEALGGLKWYVRKEYLDDALERLLREPNQPGITQLPFRSGKAAYREAFLAETQRCHQFAPGGGG